MGMDFEEIKGNSTCKQKEYARHLLPNRRWNLKGNRTYVRVIAIISMLISTLGITFYVNTTEVSTMSDFAFALHGLTIAQFSLQFLVGIVLLLGITKGQYGGNHYLHLSTSIWSWVSRFLIIFHTLNISTHYFFWNVNPMKTIYELYVSLISGFDVIFLAIGVHFVKLFLIEMDVNKGWDLEIDK